MTQDKLYTAMTQIEDYLDKSLSILGLYSLVYKPVLYNKFKLLYDSLPQELIDNKDLLNSQKEENIFSLLNKMSFILEQPKTFLGFMLVNKNVITSNLDEMYASLPEDIKICRGDDNMVVNDIETMEIPDFLKK